MLAKPTILLTGATGYVGGRLLQRLLKRGEHVRCVSRRPETLRDRFGDKVDAVEGDVLDHDSLRSALQGIDTAYYLVHALAKKEGFFAEELNGARNFAHAAREAGVKRIIYLGGLGHGESLSPHLASRHEVGRVLADSGLEVVELRAGIILGAGSLSYEMIRALVSKLPVMVTPRWTRVRTQPIAVTDVLTYLEASLDLNFDKPEHRIYEIGAPETVSYQGLMTEYAHLRGLKRFILPVPILSPKVSSLWLGLVTPVYAQVGQKLLEGVKNETVVKSERARQDFSIQPITIREALQQAWEEEERQVFETRWSDAVSSLDKPKLGGVRFGNRLIDTRSTHVAAPPERAFLPIVRIGGKQGYYAADFLWHLRGLLDLFAGGAGMRRGRRDPEQVSVGDTIDFWRVEAIEPDHLLRLYAEMRLPGRAWLQFEVTPHEDGGSTIHQTAIFDPLGLGGLLYWYAIWPAHAYVFRAMIKGIANRVTQ
ncbi:SDR family oxidoreductase [bacterium]|nr:SDR family oxidoreductase [bacterium]